MKPSTSATWVTHKRPVSAEKVDYGFKKEKKWLLTRRLIAESRIKQAEKHMLTKIQKQYSNSRKQLVINKIHTALAERTNFHLEEMVEVTRGLDPEARFRGLAQQRIERLRFIARQSRLKMSNIALEWENRRLKHENQAVRRQAHRHRPRRVKFRSY